MASSPNQNTINISLVANNFNVAKPTINTHQSQSYHHQVYDQMNRTHNNGNQQWNSYQILPFCLNLNNKGTGTSPSSLVQRELKGLKPSEQQAFIKKKLCEKVKSLDPKLNEPCLSSVVEMLMKMQRKTQRNFLNIFDDDMALMSKINEATAVLARQSNRNTNFMHSSPQRPRPNPLKTLNSQSVSLQSMPNLLSPTNPSSYHSPSNSPSKSSMTLPMVQSPPAIVQSNLPQNASIVTMNKTEYEELMGKYNGLQMENQTLKSELKYSKWKWHDVYQWIICLNNKQFMCYGQVLYDGLKRECIDGSIIKNLTVNDWELLGLTNVNDIKCLMQEIQKLFNMPCKVQQEKEEKEEKGQSVSDSKVNKRHDVNTQLFGHQMQINALSQELSMIEARHKEQICMLQHGFQQKEKQCQEYMEAIQKWVSYCKFLEKQKEDLELKCCELDSKQIELVNKLKFDHGKSKNVLSSKYEKENKNDDDCKDENVTIDKFNYMDWDYQQVYLWIIGIENGRFEKYTKIYDNLKKEDIDGTCMKQLDKSDIHRIGITNFQDKALLMEHIEKLIDNGLTPN